MKKRTIHTLLLPTLFTLFAAISFTSCSSSDGGYTPPEPTFLERYYFNVKQANHINDFFPEHNSEKAITSIGPESVNLQTGKSVTFEIAVAEEIKLNKFYIGAENIPSTNVVPGYYEVTAKKEKEVFANLCKYKVTLNFPENAKSDFLVKIAGVTTKKNGATEITKISKVPVHLTPVVPQNVIVGRWDNLQEKDSDTPKPNNMLFEFNSKKSGYVQNYLENETIDFEYEYSPANDNLVITLKDEIIYCTVKFSTDQDTMFITEYYRFKNGEAVYPDAQTIYTLTRVYE